MTINDERDLAGMKYAGWVVARTLETLKAAVTLCDGWTLSTTDGGMAAHFEHHHDYDGCATDFDGVMSTFTH